MEAAWCPVMRPTRREFQRPFIEYVEEVFAAHPDLPMFKVIPPAGWTPRTTPFPALDSVKIHTPIRQNVFGSKGSYRCMYVEEKEMTVAAFKQLADVETQEARALQSRGASVASAAAAISSAGKDGGKEGGMEGMEGRQAEQLPSTDDADAAALLLERAFWSHITVRPPLYGADTPVSFFDPQLPFGWNLRELGDLLHTHRVPEVPGVTTPMTYFGMWRSFFGWHKEDADLLSINFLHFGAPKMWYCVSPKDACKFERLAAGLFPALHKACHAFIRHKDIMLSPSLLRAHGISFMQARHTEGEFIVLNASAYHSGFNLGFNCAEAVNFATQSWLDAGRRATPCRCQPDTVRISMRLFDPSWVDSGEESSSSEDGEADGAGAKRRRRGRPRGRPKGASGGGGGGGMGMGMMSAYKRAKLAASADGDEEVTGQPCATVGEDEAGAKFFCLVQRVRRQASAKGLVVLRWLREDPDGLYRPTTTYWEERADSVVQVRTQFLPDGLRKRPAKEAEAAAGAEGAPAAAVERQGGGAGWKLLTLKSKILDTELVD